MVERDDIPDAITVKDIENAVALLKTAEIPRFDGTHYTAFISSWALADMKYSFFCDHVADGEYMSARGWRRRCDVARPMQGTRSYAERSALLGRAAAEKRLWKRRRPGVPFELSARLKADAGYEVEGDPILARLQP